MTLAAEHGHVYTVRWLVDVAAAPATKAALAKAAKYGHMDMLM